MITFEPKDEPQAVWSFGDVKVSAIRSTHTAGHASYRVDTPAGSVVIGGDASNDVLVPPRTSSTSDQVEKLAKGVDIIVHSTTHPVLGPDRDTDSPRSSIIARARLPILALWQSGGERSTSCSTSCPVARSGATQPLERSGRSIDGSGLPQSGRGGWVHGDYDCRDRSCDRAASGEVSESSVCRRVDTRKPPI